MKQRVLCVVLSGLLLLAVPASATPGSANNPVVTLRYLEDTFLPNVTTKTNTAYAAYANSRFNTVRSQAQVLLGRVNAAGSADGHRALTRNVMKRLSFRTAGPATLLLRPGAALTLGQGTSFQVHNSGAVYHDSGTLVNTSLGRDVRSKALLPARNRFISLSSGTTVVAAGNATVTVTGSYRITPPYVPMYKDLCDALMTMGIVNTYQLERSATRMEMFIIFVTLLGVKPEASSYPGGHPFTDVAWGHEYVAWLYANGHTAGTGGGRFSPDDPGSVQQLCFLMLRALGYRDGIDVTFATAVSDAVRHGVFSQRELDILLSENFTRDALMYMTYYSLGATYKDSSLTVLDRLIASGQVRKPDADRAIGEVTRKRFG
jgi:hypothetical protein